MSVTFTTEMSPVTGYEVTCGCDEATGPVFETFTDAENYLIPLVEDESLRTPLPGCSDPEMCLMYRLSIHPLETDPAPSINVANGNAADLFRALGLLTDNPADRAAGSVTFDGVGVVAAPMAEDSPWNGGGMSPADFLGRVLLALAITPADEGRFAVETVRLGGSVIIECSRPIGYLQDRLAQLHHLAQFAVSRGRTEVFWS